MHTKVQVWDSVDQLCFIISVTSECAKQVHAKTYLSVGLQCIPRIISWKINIFIFWWQIKVLKDMQGWISCSEVVDWGQPALEKRGPRLSCTSQSGVQKKCPRKSAFSPALQYFLQISNKSNRNQCKSMGFSEDARINLLVLQILFLPTLLPFQKTTNVNMLAPS